MHIVIIFIVSTRTWGGGEIFLFKLKLVKLDRDPFHIHTLNTWRLSLISTSPSFSLQISNSKFSQLLLNPRRTFMNYKGLVSVSSLPRIWIICFWNFIHIIFNSMSFWTGENSFASRSHSLVDFRLCLGCLREKSDNAIKKIRLSATETATWKIQEEKRVSHRSVEFVINFPHRSAECCVCSMSSCWVWE